MAVSQVDREAQTIAILKANPLVWGLFYCAHHFRSRSPGFHEEILKEALNNRFLAIASPRESAKSTILSFLLPTHAVCYQKKRFIVIVTNTFKKSAQTLETIKKEIRDNSEILKDFRIEITRDAEGDSIFTHSDGWECRVLCKGVEQIGSIRGEKFGAYRPDLIIGDDMEDDELVKNPVRRRDLKDLFDEALIPAGDREFCDYIFIGTILHDDSQMAKLVDPDYYPEYHKILYRALNKDKKGNFVSLWEEKWTVADLLKLKHDKPSVFAKEYQNDPSYGIFGVFKRENFRYWEIRDNDYILYDERGEVISKNELTTCKAAIACDLAWEEKRESDFTVIMPAFLTRQSDILVETYICRKGMRPHEIEEILFTMEERLRKITGVSVPIGFEKAKLEKVMKWLLAQAMRKRNHYLILKDLQWDTDKIQRIETRLEGRYATNTIYHKRGMSELEHQLLRLRAGVHDDLADGLQGVVQLLQFPKGKAKPKPQKNAFDWWRQLAIDAKNPSKSEYIFGSKNQRFGIPSKIGYDTIESEKGANNGWC